MSTALEVRAAFSDTTSRGYRASSAGTAKTSTRALTTSPLFDESFIAGLWGEYKGSCSDTARTQLIVHFMAGHVRKVAERLRTQLPKQVDVDDLVQSAYARLVGCIESFDLSQNTRFETFSSPYLIGAMKDYLRELDDLPRLARQRCKHMHQLREAFYKANGREPTVDELRLKLKHLSPRKFRRMLSDSRAASIVSFSSVGAKGGDGAESSDAMSGFRDQHLMSPLSKAEREDLKRWLTNGFARRDRLIIVLYYYEHMTMKDIGMTLGCSESRVSQRLELIKHSLRARLKRVGAEQELLTK